MNFFEQFHWKYILRDWLKVKLTQKLTSNLASINILTTFLWPLREAKCKGECLAVKWRTRLGLVRRSNSTVSARPYCAAKSSADSSLTLRCVGSDPFCSSSDTTDVWPYCEAMISAVSLSLFCSTIEQIFF